jgi:uncharacterized protein (TIGR00255 family)
MSVRSMTGYGRASLQQGGLRVEVEISSVNRKQLDIALSLPRALNRLEARIHEEIARVLSRGRISVDISVRRSGAQAHDRVRLNEGLARAYVTALRPAGRRLGLADDLRLSHLLALPGLLHVEAAEEDAERVWPPLQQALQRALGKLDQMRRREGAALARDLNARLGLMERITREIMTLSPGAVSRYRDALKQRIAGLQREVAVSDERLERELILYADRSDITEETTRIRSHLQQARALLRASEPAGKALDFLAQELYREINTVGSKAADAGIGQRVVVFKTELDRLREQVQNLQ